MNFATRSAVLESTQYRGTKPSYVACFIRPVFFVRWMAPKIEDVSRVAAEFFQAYQRFGNRIVYVAIVPEECEPPDDAVRMAMTRGRDEVLPYCESMHIVMEGQGFRYAILRNALATMQFFGRGRDQVRIYRTLDEALVKLVRSASPGYEIDRNALLAKARAIGILSAPTVRLR
jgi:hypothetical protein